MENCFYVDKRRLQVLRKKISTLYFFPILAISKGKGEINDPHRSYRKLKNEATLSQIGTHFYFSIFTHWKSIWQRCSSIATQPIHREQSIKFLYSRYYICHSDEICRSFWISIPTILMIEIPRTWIYYFGYSFKISLFPSNFNKILIHFQRIVT